MSFFPLVVSADQTIIDVTLNGQGAVMVEPGGAITVNITVLIDGKTSGANGRWYSTRWRIGNGGYSCIDHADFSGTGSYSTTLSIVAPAGSGTYTASFQAYSSNTCGGKRSGSYDMTNAVTVTSVSSSPVAEYRLDESQWSGVSGEVTDSSGNGHQGTAVNNATTEAAGQVCRSGDFDGASYFQVASLSALLNGTASLAFWIKTTQTGDNTAWRAPGVTGVEQNGGTDDIFWGWLDASGHIGVSVGNDNSSKSTVAINNGIWHHVVLTRHAATGAYNIYIDGSLNKSGKIASGVIGTTFSSIGRIEDTGGSPEYLLGALDEVLIFDTVLSSAEVQAGYANQSAGKNWDGTVRVCSAVGLDHIRLEHDGQGLTCMGEMVTVTACVDADCTGLYTDEVTLDFSSPSTGWSADPVTFTGGSANVSLNRTTVGSVMLDATATSPTAAANTECVNSGGGNACEITFADIGILIDGDDSDSAAESAIVTQLAAKPSRIGYGASNQRVRVVRTDNATGACVAAVGNQTLDATFSYLVPNAGEGLDDNVLSVDAASSGNLSASGFGQVLQLAFDGVGTAPFSFTSQDAGRYQLRVAMAIPAVDAGGVPTGATVAASDTSNSFVVRPLAVYADATGNPKAQDADGGFFGSAGGAFTLGYRSLRWSAGRDNDNDGVWDSCSSPTLTDPGGYARVPAWSIGQAAADLRQPVGGNAGTLSHGSGDVTLPTGAISVDEGTVAYSEVGIIQLQQDSINPFLSEPVKLCSPYIGRFTPADFSFTISQHGALLNSCAAGGFSYAGTPISYAVPQLPTAVITARNNSGITTHNYTGAFMKLPLGGINMPDIDSDATQLGADGVTKVKLDWSGGLPALTDNGDGTLTFGLSGDIFTYDHTDNDRVVPFISDVRLAVQDITDNDGVSATGLPQSFTPTGVEIRYGRMAMQNAQGSELLPLRVPLQVEYYAGTASGFVVNGADICTAGVTLTLSGPVGQVVITGGSRNTAIYASAAEAGAYAADDLSDPLLLFSQPLAGGNGGKFNLNLQPPGQGNAGSTVVVVEVPPWLKYDWNGTGVADPSAKATFGVFSRPGGLIYQRETY